MSPAEREFRDYLGDILDHARKLKSFVAGMSRSLSSGARSAARGRRSAPGEQNG